MVTISEKEYAKLKKFWDTMHSAQRKWENKNKDKRKEYARRWREKNREHIREYQKKYYGRVDNKNESVIIGDEQC